MKLNLLKFLFLCFLRSKLATSILRNQAPLSLSSLLNSTLLEDDNGNILINGRHQDSQLNIDNTSLVNPILIIQNFNIVRIKGNSLCGNVSLDFKYCNDIYFEDKSLACTEKLKISLYSSEIHSTKAFNSLKTFFLVRMSSFYFSIFLTKYFSCLCFYLA